MKPAFYGVQSLAAFVSFGVREASHRLQEINIKAGILKGFFEGFLSLFKIGDVSLLVL